LPRSAGVAFLQAGEEMGYEIRDVNSEIQTGYGLYQFTMRRGYRCSSSKAFLQPVRLRRNLHVALWSHVTKVLIDRDTKRAYGVEFERDGHKRTALARREVVLSAGAINSPQLLMLSGKRERTPSFAACSSREKTKIREPSPPPTPRPLRRHA